MDGVGSDEAGKEARRVWVARVKRVEACGWEREV